MYSGQHVVRQLKGTSGIVKLPCKLRSGGLSTVNCESSLAFPCKGPTCFHCVVVSEKPG